MSLNDMTLAKVTYGKYATRVANEVAYGIYEWFSSQYCCCFSLDCHGREEIGFGFVVGGIFRTTSLAQCGTLVG